MLGGGGNNTFSLFKLLGILTFYAMFDYLIFLVINIITIKYIIF
jgi:hypothetical protein